MQITMFAPAPSDVLSRAFFDNVTGDFDPQVLSASPTQIRFTYPGQGLITTINGFGMSIGGVTDTGTITEILIHTTGGDLVASFTDFAWALNDFGNALEAAAVDNNQPLANLLNLQPIFVDLAATTSGINFNLFGGLVTSQVTVRGGTGNDTISGSFGVTELFGGNGNDLLQPSGHNDPDYAYIDPGRGSDIIDGTFFTNGYLEVEHRDTRTTSQTITINGRNGTIDKGAGNGVTTLVNFPGPQPGGYSDLEITASSANDIINITAPSDGRLGIAPGAGNDLINLGLSSGLVRISLQRDSGGGATQGAVVNLGTGFIANDGYGGQDTITGIGNVRIELQGTNNADNIIGSMFNDIFIPRGGNDTVDGGGGNDRLRYDRGGMTSGVNVDLGAQTATGSWNGVAFTHRLISIEDVRGTRFDDTIRGTSGNDTLEGREGNDNLFGGDGNDMLRPGKGNGMIGADYVDPGRGNDTIDAWDGQDSFLFVEHRDLVNVGQTVFVNGDYGEVSKGGFGTTQMWNLRFPQTNQGMGLVGSNMNDIFDISLLNNAWMELQGGQGNDAFFISMINPSDFGTVRLSFHRDAAGNAATQGLVANLETGTIANDGFGFADTIEVNGNIAVEIRGTDRADRITGSAANERFILQGGNDTLDGGGGIDRLRYNRAEATSGVRVDLEAGRATGTWNGVAFTHTLTSIEDIRGTDFNDILMGSLFAPDNTPGTWSERLIGNNGDDIILGDGFRLEYAVDAAAQVYRLYLAALGRVADTAGINGWASQIAWGQTTAQNVAAGFVLSNEFLNVYGPLSNAGFVGLMYQNVLGRAAATSEIDAWLALMDAGRSRAEVALGFSDSREFIARTRTEANAYIEGNNPDNWVDDIFRLYKATLAREPDIGGLLGWADRLVDRVNTMETAAAGFVGSREFQRVYGALSDTDFVSLLYQNVLGRAASVSEINGWLARIAGGDSRAQVVLGFSQSVEFINATNAGVAQWVANVTWEDDVIIGSGGNNTLAGGMLADTFVFEAWVGPSTNTVLDFDQWDHVALQGFGYGSATEALTRFTQVGSDVVFADGEVQATFRDTTLAMFTADSVWI